MAERRLGVLRADLGHVGAVLRMSDPDAKPETVHREPPCRPSATREVPNLSRNVLDMLRTADKPLRYSGIARTALEDGCVEAHSTTPKVTARKVGKPLDHHSRRAVVIGSDVGGRKPGWFVSP